MLHLCYEDLRGMALQLLADYYGTKELPFRPLDPLDFAKNYMKLTVRYENLSYGRRVILGCIAYENTVLEINPGDPKSYIPIAERTVFLDESLKKDKQRGRRNFTLAHECSHQAIYLLNPEAYGRCQCRTPGERYSLRELTTENDWFEWQANALAAELLMPVHLVTKVMSTTEKSLFTQTTNCCTRNGACSAGRQIILEYPRPLCSSDLSSWASWTIEAGKNTSKKKKSIV